MCCGGWTNIEGQFGAALVGARAKVLEQGDFIDDPEREGAEVVGTHFRCGDNQDIQGRVKVESPDDVNGGDPGLADTPEAFDDFPPSCVFEVGGDVILDGRRRR